MSEIKIFPLIFVLLFHQILQYFSLYIRPNAEFYEIHKLRSVETVIFKPVKNLVQRSGKLKLKCLDKVINVLDTIEDYDQDDETPDEKDDQKNDANVLMQKYVAMTHEFRLVSGLILIIKLKLSKNLAFFNTLSFAVLQCSVNITLILSHKKNIVKLTPSNFSFSITVALTKFFLKKV